MFKPPKKIAAFIGVVVIAGILSGCAGRAAQPVAAIQPNDDQMNCLQIHNALKLNTVEIKGLLADSSSTRGKNVAAGVIGTIIFFPALFFMDTKNAAHDEAQALVRRNGVLFKRYKIMQCTPEMEEKNTEEVILLWDDAPKQADKADTTSSQ